MAVSLSERIGYQALPEVKIHSVVNNEMNIGIHPNILITSNHSFDSQGQPMGFHYMQYHFSNPINRNDDVDFTVENKPVFSIITGIIIGEKYRNQGYGMSLHKNILEKNNEIPVFSDIRLLNSNSKRVWEKLTTEGLAIPIVDSNMNHDMLGYLSVTKSRQNKYIRHPPLAKEECQQIFSLYESQMPELCRIKNSLQY